MNGCVGVLYLAGVPMQEMMETFRASERTLRRRLREIGLTPNRRGRANGRVKNDRGYVLVCTSRGRNRRKERIELREHRVVMEAMLGRKLHPCEVVHHINGDRGDNRPENLMLFANAREHGSFHADQEVAR